MREICDCQEPVCHYGDAKWPPFSSRINGQSSVCSTVCPDRNVLLSLCEGNPLVTGGFHAQRVSTAENVSIWWRNNVHWSLMGSNHDNENALSHNGKAKILRWLEYYTIKSKCKQQGRNQYVGFSTKPCQETWLFHSQIFYGANVYKMCSKFSCKGCWSKRSFHKILVILI